MRSRQESRGITSSSYHIHVISMHHNSYANTPPTSPSMVHFMSNTTYNSLIPSHLSMHNIMPQAIKG